MSSLIDNDAWVWAIVQDPDGNEQFLGQFHEETDEMFIPIFLDKEEAQKGMGLLAQDKSKKYEPQAIIYEDLTIYAKENGFNIFLLNKDGSVLEKKIL